MYNNLFRFIIIITALSCLKQTNKKVETQILFYKQNELVNNFNIERFKLLMFERLYFLINSTDKKCENYEILVPSFENIGINYHVTSKTLFLKNETNECRKIFENVFKNVEISKLLEISKIKLDSNNVNSKSVIHKLDSMLNIPFSDEKKNIIDDYLNSNICNTSRIKNITF